ncbi:MAG: HEPN domain-containing protein [Bacteroidia bacterium]|nr:HEPN domain-containing protein [Bacteroidia bacterium]
MPNKSIANEWLESAKHNLDAAKILFKARHFNDVIGIELHQSIEKSLKAVPAFHNKPVLKIHDLIVLLSHAEEFIQFDTALSLLLETATDYYVENRYPGGGRSFLPSNKEIEKVIETADYIYNTVKEYINK